MSHTKVLKEKKKVLFGAQEPFIKAGKVCAGLGKRMPKDEMDRLGWGQHVADLCSACAR